MRRLSPPPEPRWEELVAASDDLPAVRVLFAPVTARARRLAGRASALVRDEAPEAVLAELAGAIDGGGRVRLTVSRPAFDLLIEMGEASSRALIGAGILGWEGIGGANGDDPLPVTPETIGWFLADDDLLAAADRLYVEPDARRLAEKNVWAACSPGTSAAGTAAPDIASSAASPAAADAANPMLTLARAGTDAPISSTNPKRRKAKASSTS